MAKKKMINGIEYTLQATRTSKKLANDLAQFYKENDHYVRVVYIREKVWEVYTARKIIE